MKKSKFELAPRYHSIEGLVHDLVKYVKESADFKLTSAAEAEFAASVVDFENVPFNGSVRKGFALESYKGKGTKKYFHVTILHLFYRPKSSVYELIAYCS